jgi:segregation and condensation protein A
MVCKCAAGSASEGQRLKILRPFDGRRQHMVLKNNNLSLQRPVAASPRDFRFNTMALHNSNYQIRLPQFEGPFDLLLFFIERDELDIYNIPINNIIKDFLAYIHGEETLNIELSSEFILFVSTLMRIKAKMLIPRKEIDAQGNEIDPRQELVDKILEYKKYKEAAAELAVQEAERMLLVKRGNIQRELSAIGEEASEGTEVQTITLFKLMKAFEKVMQRLHQKNNKPVHTVVPYNYSMEHTKTDMISFAQSRRTLTFESIFERAENRVHAIFLFLSMLELAQQHFLRIIIGDGRNNFLVEYNETEEGLTDEEHMHLL